MSDNGFTEEEYDFFDIGLRYANSSPKELQKKYHEYKRLFGSEAARDFWQGATSSFTVYFEPSEEIIIGADGFVHGSMSIPDTPPSAGKKAGKRA